MTNCICGASGGRPFLVAERHFGLGSEFTYLECELCGSLRIATVPSDMGRYYPQDYYSFLPRKNWRDRLQPAAMNFALLSARPHLPWIHFPWPSVAQTIGVARSDRVLDVGSGVSGMAASLRAAGQRNALGIDPFIAEDVRDELGLAVKKCYLSEIGGTWDLIAFNHSLEHTPDPLPELSTARSLLSPTGRIVVRVPVAAFAYREYGACWFQIDAPRHFFIPTERGFALLAARAGLRVAKVVYDSSYMQFFFSTMYREGTSLIAAEARFWELITRGERRRLSRRAAELNRKHQGDQAAFFLAPDS